MKYFILGLIILGFSGLCYGEDISISYNSYRVTLNENSDIIKRIKDDTVLENIGKKVVKVVNENGDIEEFTGLLFDAGNYLISKYNIEEQYKIYSNLLNATKQRGEFKTKILLGGLLADLSPEDLKLLAAIQLAHLALAIEIPSDTTYAKSILDSKEINFILSCNIKLNRYYYDKENPGITFLEYLVNKWDSVSNVYKDKKKWVDTIEFFLTTI